MRADDDPRAGSVRAPDELLHHREPFDLDVGRLLVACPPLEDRERRRDERLPLDHEVDHLLCARRVEFHRGPHRVAPLLPSVVVEQHRLPVLLRVAERDERRPERRHVLDPVDAGTDRVGRGDDLQMAHDGDSPRMRLADDDLDEPERQPEVALDRRGALVGEAVHGLARLFLVAHDIGVGRVCGVHAVEVRPAQEQPRHRRFHLSGRVVGLDPLPRISDRGHAVLQVHPGQGVVPVDVEVRVEQPRDDRHPLRVDDIGSSRNANRGARARRDDPVASYDDDGVANGRPSASVDERRADDGDRSHPLRRRDRVDLSDRWRLLATLPRDAGREAHDDERDDDTP